MKISQIISSKKSQKIFFASLFSFLFLFALVIRILYVRNKGFWYDEILTMRFDVPQASKISFNQLRFLNDYIIYNLKPYWNNEFIIRLPNLIASALSVAVLGLWMKRAMGGAQAVVAMLCLAISPCFIQHTCLCRAYGFLALFALINCWSAYEISIRQKIGWYLVFIISAVAIVITRMEGLVIPAILMFVLPFLILFKKNITLKKIFIALGTILLITCAGWFGGKLFYSKALTFSMSAMGTRPEQLTFYEFILHAGKGIANELSFKNLNFSLHHNFINSSWDFWLKYILLFGFIYLLWKKTQLGIITLLLIIFAFPLTKWLLVNFYKVPFDSRHMQHATPGFIIIFVAGLFLFLEAAREIKNVKLKIPAMIVSYALIAAGLVFYIKTAGAATVDLVKYNRIADWKQISRLTKNINDKEVFINGGGRGIEFGYYKSKFSRGNLNTCISKLNYRDKIYYFAGNKRNEVDVLNLKNYDVVTIPFDPFSVFVIYNNKSNFSNYWMRVENVLENALTIAPGHNQISDGINTAKILLGKNPIPNSKIIKIVNSEAKVKLDDWIPLYGWGNVENLDGHKFRWSSGKVSSLILPDYRDKIRKITLFGLPYFGGKNKKQEITAFLGNICLGTKNVANRWQGITFDLPIGKTGGERRLSLVFGSPVAPSAIGRGGDKRMLAFGLSNIKLSFLKKLSGGILLTADDSSESFLGDSWGKAEQWQDGRDYRWIEGNSADVFWSNDKSENGGMWEIDILPFVVKGKSQTMKIYQDDIILTNIALNNSWTKYKINALPVINGNCNLNFLFGYAIQPASIGIGNNDTRNLSAAISSIVYSPDSD